jgi:hypothetical protein
MTDYRTCIIGSDGGSASSRRFVCDTDDHAIEWAKQLLDDQPVELWQGERLVKRLSPARTEKRDSAVSHEIHDGRLVPKGKE